MIIFWLRRPKTREEAEARINALKKEYTKLKEMLDKLPTKDELREQRIRKRKELMERRRIGKKKEEGEG